MKGRQIVFVATIAGISLASPYVVAKAAKKFPNSFVARFNSGLHAAES